MARRTMETIDMTTKEYAERIGVSVQRINFLLKDLELFQKVDTPENRKRLERRMRRLVGVVKIRKVGRERLLTVDTSQL